MLKGHIQKRKRESMETTKLVEPKGRDMNALLIIDTNYHTRAHFCYPFHELYEMFHNIRFSLDLEEKEI